jgi:hypothetical protein
MQKNETLADVKKLEAALPGKRIVDFTDLEKFDSFLYRLWGQALDERIPEEFRAKLFALKEYFREYLILGEDPPFRPSKSGAIKRIETLLPFVA